MEKMKNISEKEVLTLREQVAYQPGQVVSRTLAQNSAVSVTLFSFDKGEEISTHASGGDAFVTCLDGVHEQFVEPSRKYADIIVLEGGHNLVALDMIMQRIQNHIDQH